jgi:hypothetical protein
MQLDHLKRREFVTLLSGVAAWPLVVRAQQPAKPVIGFFGGGHLILLATIGFAALIAGPAMAGDLPVRVYKRPRAVSSGHYDKFVGLRVPANSAAGMTCTSGDGLE